MDIKTILSLSDKTYNRMKWFVQIVLPAIGTLYFALSDFWDLPNPEAVVGTIMAVDFFLGVVLGISTKSYEESGRAYDGTAFVDDSNSDKTLVSLELDEDPEELISKESIRFKVAPDVAPDVSGGDISPPRPPQH